MIFLTLLSSFLFAVSSNIDNIVIGLSLGMKKIEVRKESNLLIASILSLVTLISIGIGKIFNIFMSANIANIIGGILLILFGLYSLWEAMFNDKQKNIENKSSRYGVKEILDTPEKVDLDKSGSISARESILLAVVLSLNNLGLGIGAGITGLNVSLTVIFTFIFSIIFLRLGCHLGGNYFSKVLGRYASIIAAVLIILLGLYETIV